MGVDTSHFRGEQSAEVGDAQTGSGLVGGRDVVLRADLVVKNDPARNFERPPSHPALCRQRVQLTLGAIGSASVQQL